MLLSTSLRSIGKTSLRVPRFGLGTAPLTHPEYLRTVSWDEASNTVLYALSQGIKFIDTAPYYGSGNSELLLGNALKAVPRDSYVLATKVGRLVVLGEKSYFAYTREGILRSIDESLERLQADRIDIFHLHDPDNYYREALDIAFPILDDLRRQGTIRAIGAGMNQWQMLQKFAENADFDCFLLAGRYTLLEQESLGFLEMCVQKQISILLGGIYNSGILATGPVPGATYNYAVAQPSIVERVRRIEDICQRHHVPLRIAALHFAAAHPAITSLIVGMQTPAEVDSLISDWQTPIPGDLWDDLQQQGLLDHNAPV